MKKQKTLMYKEFIQTRIVSLFEISRFRCRMILIALLHETEHNCVRWKKIYLEKGIV